MICITHSIADSLHEYLAKSRPDKVFVLCDANTRRFCLPKIATVASGRVIEVPDGEVCKEISVCEKIWRELAQSGASRHSLLICLGGGSITDLGGFIAATYQRGIAVCYLPTTLLCMVDAGLGGKNGINLGGLKNYIGTFRLPSAIFIDPEFLTSLPETEWQNGKAEIIKHAILSGIGWTEINNSGFPQNNNFPAWLKIIEANTRYKQEIITADFTENNTRARLNFGHTAAHALESLYLKNGIVLSHGRAVAAGMVIETMAAEMMEICKPETTKKIADFILPMFGRVGFLESDISELNKTASKDKKSLSGKVVCSFVSDVGLPCDPVSVPENIMTKAWLRYINETA